jgi:hypothetical protein
VGELQIERYAPLLLMKASRSGVFIHPGADPLSVGNSDQTAETV